MTKLLGVVVVNGLSSENRVFATLLAERGTAYDARVLMQQDVDGEPWADRFADLAGCSVAPVDTGWRPSPYARRGNPLRIRAAARYLRRLRRLVDDARSYAPDVAYSSQQHIDCRAASKIAASLAVPQIIHLHYNVGPWLRRSVLERLRTADLVVTVSDFIREQAIEHGRPEDRVVTLHNAVAVHPPPDPERSRDLRAELDLPGDAVTFGMVSRIDEGKGHLDAVDAFERVARDDLRLVIVGSGRIDAEVRQRIARSPAADRIVLTGYRTDVDDLLGIFDALVHPALQDPCPLAVLEAMAAGLPVLGYADGGVPELVVDGETGLLVETERVDDLTEAFRTIADDRGLARRLGGAARERAASRFTPAQAGRRFAEIVESAR